MLNAFLKNLPTSSVSVELDLKAMDTTVDVRFNNICITLHGAIRFTIHTRLFCFSKFHKFLNQYQACLYLLECISRCDSTYGNKIIRL